MKIGVIGDPDQYVPSEWRERRAARAVIRDVDGKIALMHVTNHGYYKLPGGGIDEGESILAALHREVLEEVGATITDVVELGETEEIAPSRNIHQISYCFVASLDAVVSSPELTDDEKIMGLEVFWADDLEQAIELVATSGTDEAVAAPFIAERDSLILREAARHD